MAQNPDFRFTVKMWQRFTHQRKLAWTPAEADEVRAGFDVMMNEERHRDSIGPSAHATSHVGYVRIHGRNYQDWFRKDASVEQRYNYLYNADELKPWAARVTEVAEDPLEAAARPYAGK